MNTYKTMGSVTYRLISYINNSNKKDVDYEIAKIILSNFKDISNMNIIEIAELCFVSPATISRFCKHIGFENFQEFKRMASIKFSISEDYSENLKENANRNVKESLIQYTESIKNNIDYIINNIDIDKLDEIVKQIHDSKRVAIFGAQIFNNIGMILQSKLILNNKFIEAYASYNNQLLCSQSLDDKDLAIIISVEGSFLFKYMDIVNNIRENNVKIVLITQNINSKFADIADEVLICGNSNRNNEGRISTMYLIEVLIMRYGLIYSDK